MCPLDVTIAFLATQTNGPSSATLKPPGLSSPIFSFPYWFPIWIYRGNGLSWTKTSFMFSSTTPARWLCSLLVHFYSKQTWLRILSILLQLRNESVGWVSVKKFKMILKQMENFVRSEKKCTWKRATVEMMTVKSIAVLMGDERGNENKKWKTWIIYTPTFSGFFPFDKKQDMKCVTGQRALPSLVVLIFELYLLYLINSFLKSNSLWADLMCHPCCPKMWKNEKSRCKAPSAPRT